ncbi:MAG TPA: CRTAC1 family protein [Candidatus Limnocylindrales bacterium]
MTRSRPVAALLAVAAVGLIALGVARLGTGPRPGTGGPVVVPRFVEETAEAGLDHRYDGEFEYFVGGGVAVFDCDGDRRDDLYIAGGSRPAGVFRNTSAVGGELRFERIASAATDLRAVVGAYPLDVDGDRITDLAVLRHGGNVLLRGLPQCGFERSNEDWGFDGGEARTTAFSATWERGASWPTLAFGNYLDESSDDPEHLCFDNVLVRPAVVGRGFGEPAPLRPSWCALSMLFSDWDRSGRRDLRVSNDRHYYPDTSAGQEQLFRLDPDRPPREYTEGDGWQRLRIWGMGIASHDLTGDGYPEVYLTSQGDQKLQTLAVGSAQPRYEDIAVARGAAAHRPYTGDTPLPSTGWHDEFDDVNNDGLMDLFVAKGNVEAQPDYAARDPSNLLLGQPDGTFREAASEAGIVSFDRARGAALADLNLDGWLDLVVVNRRVPVRVWRNTGAGDGRSLAVRLVQYGTNRDAVGAWIEVRAGGRVTEREVTIGGGHAGGQLGFTHFGLGGADRVEVRVRWPDGELSPWLAATPGFAIVERDAAEVVPWDPRP